MEEVVTTTVYKAKVVVVEPARNAARTGTTIQEPVGASTPFEGEKSTPPLCYMTQAELVRRRVIQDLLQLKAIQVVTKDTKVFLSSVFTVPKLEGGREHGKMFILNL